MYSNYWKHGEDVPLPFNSDVPVFNFPGCFSGRDEAKLITSHCGRGRKTLSVAQAACLCCSLNYSDTMTLCVAEYVWQTTLLSGCNASESAHLYLFQQQLLASLGAEGVIMWKTGYPCSKCTQVDFKDSPIIPSLFEC